MELIFRRFFQINLLLHIYTKMSIVLPKELRYSDVLPSLPAGVQNLEQYLSPINGSSFSCATAGTIIQIDLPSRGYAVPDSFYIKYKYTIVSTGESKMRATPVYTPLQKLETIFGSQTVESINNYNVVQNLIVNTTLNVAMKYGLQSSYGFRCDNDVTPSLESFDGRHCENNEVGSFAAPLSCLLSNSDKLVPLGFMPSVRIQITLDSINNIFCSAQSAITADAVTGTPAAAATILPNDFIISEFQLCYTMLDLGPDIDNIVRSMGDKLLIKSQSFTNSTSTVAQGTNGSIELVYSQRLASIKSLFLLNSSTSINGIFDSFDITTAGDYQFSIAGKYFPQRPINASVGKNGILMELKKAVGSLMDKHNNFSINSIEFNRVIGSSSTLIAPAKCYIGINTELMPSNGVLLSGTSTQSSPITVRINITTATAAIASCSLIACYDAIIEIEPLSKTAVVRQ
jgi:hypothetical protein